MNDRIITRFLLPLTCASAFAADDYKPGPDAEPREGVLHGEVRKLPPFTESKVFPGTTRDWSIYVEPVCSRA